MTRTTSRVWDQNRGEVDSFRPPASEVEAKRRADEFTIHDLRIAMSVVSLARWRRPGDERVAEAIRDVRAALERLIRALIDLHRTEWAFNADVREDAS